MKRIGTTIGSRMVLMIVALALCISTASVTLADAPSSAGWSVTPFGKGGLRIYKHAAIDSADADVIDSNSIDLSDPLHFCISANGISYSGFAMMRVDGPDSDTVPVPGSTIADKGYYQLSGSTSSWSSCEYFRSPDAETIKNYSADGSSYTEATYPDGTTMYDHGMYLQYQAGASKDKYYISPGYYRFVYFHRQSKTIKYSDIYHITDKNGVFTEPGSADITVLLSGIDEPVSTFFSDDVFDITINSLTSADGNNVSPEDVSISTIDFITNYWAIPINGSSLDSIVSYTLNKVYTMYNGKELEDGRTLDKGNNAITLRNCTAKYTPGGKYLASMCSDGEMYKLRTKITATVGGEQKVFITDAPVTLTAAYTVTTIITDSLPSGSLETQYSTQLSGAAPDKSKLNWTVDSGTFPAGLTLSEDGKITGVPTAAGTYTFSLKATATGDGTSATKEFSLEITKRQLSGYWKLSMTPQSYYRNVITSYTCTAKPFQKGGTPFEGTPVSGASLTVSIGDGLLQNDSTVTVTKPSSGVTAEITSYNGSLTLVFDGSTAIDADGIEFTISKAKNPDLSYLFASLASTVNYEYGRFVTDTAEMDIINAYTDIPLISTDGLVLTIDNWVDGKMPPFRAVISSGEGESVFSINRKVTSLSNTGIEKGDEFTIRLEATDALWDNYVYYQSGTLVGDGEGNSISVTLSPSDENTLTPYTMTCSAGGNPINDVFLYLYKDGRALNTNGYYWMREVNGLTAKAQSNRFYDAYPGYDPIGTVTVDGTNINVDFPEFERTACITGIVKNTSGEPLPYASVVASADICEHTVTFNTVTASDGSFSFYNMYNGKMTEITAWTDGYGENSVSVTPSGTAEADITLEPAAGIIVTTKDGQSVTKPVFTVYDDMDKAITSFRFLSGSRFTLVLPSTASTDANAAYKVAMTSNDTNGITEETAVFDGASAYTNVYLAPERLGRIDWSEIDGVDFRVLVYKNGSMFRSYNSTELYCDVPAGEYTVYLSNEYQLTNDDPSEQVTVESGKTVSLTIEPPSSDMFVVATAKGPRLSEKDKYYEVSGIIESETDKSGDKFFGLDASMPVSATVLGYKINGSYVGLTDNIDGRSGWAVVNKHYAPSEYPFVDWGFPLHYTLYVRQNADYGDSQSVTMYACYGNGKKVSIGTVTTISAPGITISCPETVGARTVKTEISGTETDTLLPDEIEFSGTAPADSTVRIYDNDTLTAIARCDSDGRYSGRAQISSGYRSHTLRAEANTDFSGEDTVISAEKSFTYSPTGPRLTGLWMNGTRLSITGGMTAYSPKRGNTVYHASFENEDRLADITMADVSKLPTENGEREEITGKVFFLVTTDIGGSHILAAEKNAAGLWEASYNFADSNPLDVKVLYEEADNLTAPTVTITDVNADNAQVELKNDAGENLIDNVFEAKLKDGETSTWDDKSDLLEILGISKGDEVTDDTNVLDPEYTWVPDDTDYDLFSLDVDNAEEVCGLDDYFALFSNTKSTSELMQSVVAQLEATGAVDDPGDESLTNVDGIKEISAMTTSQAYKRSGQYYEQRTWIDSPSWTMEGVKWRIEELTANGYKSNALTDSESGNQYIYFSQLLYYSHYGDPVDALYKKASDNGIPKSVVSPLMFANGKMIGSALQVRYLYDVSKGKWMRMQTAIMPPDTTSPIHTAPNQIPNKVERPYRYVPVSDLELTSTSDITLMDSTNRTGGMSFKIKLDSVSEKTYGSAVCSVGGFAGGKFLQTQKVHNFVDINNAKWGKYALSYEETANTAFWTTVGNTVPHEGQSTILPTERDAEVGSLDEFRKALLSNYNYYARLDKEGGAHQYTAQYGKKKTREVLEALNDLQSAIDMAGVQDTFTNNVSDQLSFWSGVIGFLGGPIGAEGSLAFDAINFIINAANDTNNAEVMAAAERFKNEVISYKATDKADKERIKKSEQEKKDYNNSTGFPIYDVDENVFNDPFDTGTAPTAPTSQTIPVHDPSGIVYEGVIENPVEGATVTLYKYDADSGIPVMHDDSSYLQQANPLTTDKDGYYRWDVPEGEWYVTATKDGYTEGNSGADKEATKTHNVGGVDMNFLPVLPPQLSVNIPLVDRTAPQITDVVYTADGIYVTFSKYMVDTGYDNDSVLNANNYTLTDRNGPVTGFSIRSIEQGHVPSNIDKYERTYTKTVKIEPAYGTVFDGDITLTVSGSASSYADTAIGSMYTNDGTVKAVIPKITITETETGAVIKNTSFYTAKVTVIVASYDENGDLTDASVEKAELGFRAEKTVSFTGEGTHKVFVWDILSGMRPLNE